MTFGSVRSQDLSLRPSTEGSVPLKAVVFSPRSFWVRAMAAPLPFQTWGSLRAPLLFPAPGHCTGRGSFLFPVHVPVEGTFTKPSGITQICARHLFPPGFRIDTLREMIPDDKQVNLQSPPWTMPCVWDSLWFLLFAGAKLVLKSLIIRQGFQPQ